MIGIGGLALSGETGIGTGPGWPGRAVMIGIGGILDLSGEMGTGTGPFCPGRAVMIGIGGFALSGDTGTGRGGAGVTVGVAEAALFEGRSFWAFAKGNATTAAKVASRASLAMAREFTNMNGFYLARPALWF